MHDVDVTLASAFMELLYIVIADGNINSSVIGVGVIKAVCPPAER